MHCELTPSVECVLHHCRVKVCASGEVQEEPQQKQAQHSDTIPLPEVLVVAVEMQCALT